MLENLNKIGAVGDGSDYSWVDNVGTDSGAPVEAPATEVAPELSPEADELVTRSLPLGDIDLDEVRREKGEAGSGGLGSPSAASPSSSGPSAASVPPHGPSGGGPGTGGPGAGGPSIPPHGPGSGGPGSPSASPSSSGPGAASGPAFVPGPTVFDPLTKFVKEGHFIYREQSARNCIMSAANILKDNNVTASVGNLLTLYMARNTKEFQTGNIIGTDTTMGALDQGRLKGLNAYIQSEYKTAMVRELGNIRKSFGTLEVADLEAICGKIQIVAVENASGEISRSKNGYVKTEVNTSDPLISGIMSGKETAEFKAIREEKIVGWELDDGRVLSQSDVLKEIVNGKPTSTLTPNTDTASGKVVSWRLEDGSTITHKDLIKNIQDGKDIPGLTAARQTEVVGWQLASGTVMTEDGRKSIAAKIVGAHYDGSTALEHKGDKLIESVAPWAEGMQPHELKRFQMAFKGTVTEDGLIRSRFSALMGDFWKIFEIAIRKGG
jgi:hypothetical protein